MINFAYIEESKERCYSGIDIFDPFFKVLVKVRIVQRCSVSSFENVCVRIGKISDRRILIENVHRYNILGSASDKGDNSHEIACASISKSLRYFSAIAQRDLTKICEKL